jgi:hypothetical protein
MAMTEEEFLHFVATERAYVEVQETVENVLRQVDGRIADIHMEGIVLPRVVDYARMIVSQCVEVRRWLFMSNKETHKNTSARLLLPSSPNGTQARGTIFATSSYISQYLM